MKQKMSRLTKSVVLFSIYIILFASCKENKYEKQMLAASQEYANRQTAMIKNLNDSVLLNWGKSNSLLGGEKVSGALSGPIKYEWLAKLYIGNYKNTVPPLRSVIGGVDTPIAPTENIWINKNAIIAFAKELIDNPQLDGIRLYNARYLDAASSGDPDLDKRFNGRNTVVFVATKFVKGLTFNYHEDYYKMPNDSTTSLYIYDYNSLCPPADTCKGATLGGY